MDIASLTMNYELILDKIYSDAIAWQQKMSEVDYLFSYNSINKARSIDALSLHIDLAYMLGREITFTQYTQWILQQQDSFTGFFYETFSQSELAGHQHPRVKEMVGTYLGFQVSSLFLRLSIKAKEFKFWRFLFEDDEAIQGYLRAMPWTRSPWGAGGWVDSIGTMLFANYNWGYNSRYKYCFDQLLHWLSTNQCPTSGLWGSNEIQGVQGQINGAYHLLRGTFFLSNTPLTFNSLALYDSVIDYSKSSQEFSENGGDACNDLDLSFLLYKLNILHPSHRKDEVVHFASTRFHQLSLNLNKDGLFGFFRNKSQDFHNYHFVGPSVSGSSDIQGVVFYLTTLFYLIKIIEPDAKLPWIPSLTHG